MNKKIIIVVILLIIVGIGIFFLLRKPPLPPAEEPIIKNIIASSPILPFESNGDLWFSSWADDNTVFVSWGDGFGPNLETRPLYSHHGLAKLSGTFPDVNAEIVKSSMPLSDDANNSKPSGLLFYNGHLYVSIHSPLLYPDIGFIAYSDDYGETFKYNLNSPWKKEVGSNFVCLMFINMGKNYNLNKDGYIYAFGIGSEINWHGPVYLARVPKDSVIDYSAWTYFIGLDGENNPKWSKNQFDAVPVEGLNTKHQLSSIYHPGIKRYIVLTAETGKGELFEASNPWGPWTLVGKWFEGPSSEWFTSYMPGIITKDTGKNTFYFAVAGRETKEGTPEDKKYRFQLGNITMVNK